MSTRSEANAFPSVVGDPGLTVREYFAGLAIQNPLVTNFPNRSERKTAEAAERAVAMADALLVELAKGKLPRNKARRFLAILPPDMYSESAHRGDPVMAVLASEYDSLISELSK